MGMPPPRAEFWMGKAIQLAELAKMQGDKPFGCVIVDDLDQLVSEAWGTGRNADPLRHSECLAITEACRVKDGLLEDCTIYSTHEPCLMCTGAIFHAHLSVVVYGSAREDVPEFFRPYSVIGVSRWRESSHSPIVAGGILRAECVALFRGA